MILTRSIVQEHILERYGYKFYHMASSDFWSSKSYFRKEITPKVFVEIDYHTCEVKAYKKKKNWIGAEVWKPIRVYHKWIKDIEHFVVLEYK